MALAQKKAGCDANGRRSQECGCQKKLAACKACDICTLLADGAYPIVNIRTPPVGSWAAGMVTWDAWVVNSLWFLPESLRTPKVDVYFNPNYKQQCTKAGDAAAITELADTMIHEAVHACIAINGHDTLDGAGECSGAAIAAECMK